MTVSNWNGSARCTPARVVAPRDRDELIAIVRDDAQYPTPLRAVGELHSLNECFTTTGTIVFMKHFSTIGTPARGTVTVGAGVRMIDLKNALKKHRLQLEVVPEIGNATAGSVACCGTKDSSLKGRPGQISSTVVGVRMITPDGTDDPVTVASDCERLRLIRSSYGLLGIIYEVTFAVIERKKVAYRYERVKLDDWLKAPGGRTPLPPPGSAEILGNADGFLGFLLPYRREIIVERRTEAARHHPILALDWLKLWLRTVAWTTGARPFNVPLFRLLPRRLRRGLIALWIRALDRGLLDWFFYSLLSRFEHYRADAMIDFKRPASSYFEFTFWAFPVSTWDTALPEYLDFCERFRQRTGFRPALPTEIYYIARDERAVLSFSAEEDIFTLDMVNWTDEEPACWREMNLEFNEFAARHGARPLLNQTKFLSPLSPTIQNRLWVQPGWQQLADARRAADPMDRFFTPFFAGLLP